MRLERYFFLLVSIYTLMFASGTLYQIPEIRYFHHIALTVVLGGWLLWRVLHGKGLPSTPLNGLLFLVAGWWFVTVPFSLDARLALENLWFPVTYLILFWIAASVVQHGHERMMMDAFFIMALMVVFMSAIQVASVYLGLGIGRPVGEGWAEYIGRGVPLPWQRDMRIFLPLGVSTWVAGVVSPLAVVSFAWGLSMPRRTNRFLFWLLSASLLLVLILTFSRGGMISALIAISAFVMFWILGSGRLDQLFTRRNLFLMGGVAVIGTVVLSTVLLIGSSRSRQSGDSTRVDLWRSAAEMIQDAPLTGVGAGLYGLALREYRSLDVAIDRLSTAHNAYLNGTAETGLITLLLALGLMGIIGKKWWVRWRNLPEKSIRNVRLIGVMAALLGFAGHNVFDTLGFAAGVGLLIALVVYSIMEVEDTPQHDHPLTALVALLVIVAYGLGFVVISDPAQRHFEASVAAETPQQALIEIERAINRDPYMTLYDLQWAHTKGELAVAVDTAAARAEAIAAYDHALALHPTWDTGWLNLGLLYEAQGQPEQALQAYDRAAQITLNTPAYFHWARLAEDTGLSDENRIVERYQTAMFRARYLPLAPLWYETPLRRRALEQHTAAQPLNWQYETWSVHDPDRAAALVPDDPRTAAEWWVVGAHTLYTNRDPALAEAAFTQAIALNPAMGDYYAARARARLTTDREGALSDLAIARFLETFAAYPNAIEIALTDDPAKVEELRQTSLPPRFVTQDFEGVVFAQRVAQFTILGENGYPGRGDAALQPLYDLAIAYENEGNIEQAIRTYHVIQSYAPYDERADDALAALQGTG